MQLVILWQTDLEASSQTFKDLKFYSNYFCVRVCLIVFLVGSTVTNYKRLFSPSIQGVTYSGRNPLSLELPREEETFNSTEAKIYANSN